MSDMLDMFRWARRAAYLNKINSFNWELLGSNPRTKRNDIQATLVLYFQSLDQIFGSTNNNLIKEYYFNYMKLRFF